MGIKRGPMEVQDLSLLLLHYIQTPFNPYPFNPYPFEDQAKLSLAYLLVTQLPLPL